MNYRLELQWLVIGPPLKRVWDKPSIVGVDWKEVFRATSTPVLLAYKWMSVHNKNFGRAGSWFFEFLDAEVATRNPPEGFLDREHRIDW